ncbi:hypothetical protein D9M69_563840 [compost metagenome]
MHTGLLARAKIAKSNRDIRFSAPYIDNSQGRIQFEFDRWMALEETAKSVDQPVRGERGEQAHTQPGLPGSRAHPRGALRQHSEGLVDGGKKHRACLGQLYALTLATKEWSTQSTLELLDVVAHRALRN